MQLLSVRRSGYQNQTRHGAANPVAVTRGKLYGIGSSKVLALQNLLEEQVRKKIRVVQLGVGPIGASIARLMRQKTAIEIVGAIDKDPAKAGRDLGEVVGASDAPWGVVISAESQPALEKSVDIVVHSTSSYLTSVMDQLMECLAAGCCIVSTCEELAYPWKKHPELSKQLDEAAKEEGVALLGT